MSYAPRHARPTPRRWRRPPGLVGGGAAASVAVLAVASAPAAFAAVNHNPVGHLDRLTLTSATATATGWALDPDDPMSTTVLSLVVDGRTLTRTHTTLPRPDVVRTHRANPRTGFQLTAHLPAGRHTLCVVVQNQGPGRNSGLGCRTVTVATAGTVSANTAIAREAASFVGARYVAGGASPSGFDCSGLVMYVYAKAARINLPHSAQSQYQLAHRIAVGQARAGDLVFFHDGAGRVYHVGIYAGNAMMWSAATPADGVRYQTVWSTAVTYGSFTHR